MTDANTSSNATTATPPVAKTHSGWLGGLTSGLRRWVPGSRRAWLRGLAGLGTLALLWTLLISLWLPGWLRPRVEAGASQALGAPVRLGAIRVQPWTLHLVLEDFSFGDPQAPWLLLPRSEARLSLLSLRYLAPVISQFTLHQPQLWVERQTAERFNFSAVLDHLRAQPPAPADAEPARFALHNLRINDGRIRYTDRVLRQEHLIDALQLGLPFLSNLPSDITTEVQPLLQARIDGSPLRLTGQARPFAPGRPTELTLDWRQVPLKAWAEAARPLLPPEARIDLTQGELDLQLRIGFEQPAATPQPKLRIRGRVDLRDIDLRAPAAGWQTRWHHLSLDGLDIAPLQRQARLGSVDWQGWELEPVKAQTQGSAQAPPSTPTTPAPASAAPVASASPPWQWAVNRVRINAKRILLPQVAGLDLPALGPVQLQVNDLSSAVAAKPALLRLDAADALGAKLGLQFNLARDAEGLLIHNGQAQLSQWRLALPGSRPNAKTKEAPTPDHLGLQQLDLQGLQARLLLRDGPARLARVQANSLVIDQLDAAASRDEQARWRWLNALAGKGKDDARAKAAEPAKNEPATTATPEGPPLIWQLGELRCQACRIAVQDDSVRPSAQVALTELTFSVLGASQDLSKPLKLALRSQAQGKGRLALDGTLSPQPLAMDAQLGIQALDLRVLQSYLDPLLNLTLVSANTSAAGRLRLSQPARSDQGGVDAQWQGRWAVNDLRTQDGVTHNDFVRWRALALDAMDVRWQAGALNADLGRIALDEFFGRVILHPDGHLNLADIRRSAKGAEQQSLTTPGATAAAIAPTAAASASPAPAPAPAPTTAATANTSPPTSTPTRLRWQAVRLDRGRIDFTDNFVKPNYSARLSQVQGSLSAVSSEGSTPAEVMVSATLDEGAPLRISGQLNPLGPRLYSNIEASARGIDLTRLSTYAGRYAGYAIDKGSLSVTVKYRIDQGKLQAEHQLFVDQLTFGQRVDSPDATKLPVQLAVALLKNSRGEIEVNLPVGGSLDDPQFSVGGIVLRVIGNLLLKAVTSPFALLAGAVEGLTGGDQSDQAGLGYVAFEPGSGTLSDEARSKLDALATQLTGRPQLKLEAAGHADPDSDAPGLRQRGLDRLLRNAKAEATGLPRSEVRIDANERERWLKAAYQAAELNKPRNLVGLPKALPPAEMEALLMAQIPSDAAALQALANRRADQVSSYLSAKLGPERVLLTRTSPAPSSSSTPPAAAASAAPLPTATSQARVEFKLIAQ